ncbi:zinc-carboxypeptidase [Anopheles darlingi]|uniref:Zinc-carboxypeptidase n=1 Tax=Anopheles darlingi TaxID=43151 RepID=W5JE75_ANODA|nr:zinc-carboxypeptidase [Anopheles darlingi]
MMKLLPVLLFLGVACLSHAQFYENYKLYELLVKDSDHVNELNFWHNEGTLDFWSHAAPNRSVTVMISPRVRRRFEQMLKEEDIEFKVMMENVQEMLDAEKAWRKEQERIRPTNGAIDFNHFWTLDEINSYLEKLSVAYPKLVTLVEIGRTTLNRPINAVTISTKGRINQKRPVVLIDAGLQAREWASHMAVMHLIHQLVVNSDANQELLKNTDWVVVPVANPDGYAYSHEMNRLWRKNRSAGKTICPGADLSHNFPFRWHYTSNSCTEGYSGSAPASESETRALMLLMAQYARSMKMYLTVHACGEYILYPYGYDNVQVPNAAVLHMLGEQAARAARNVRGTVYQVGSAGSLLTPQTGSADFVYGSFGAEFTYTLELPCGRAGSAFLLETDRLAQVSAEAFEMFKVFGKFAGSTTVGRPYDSTKGNKVKDTKAVTDEADASSSSADEDTKEDVSEK